MTVPQRKRPHSPLFFTLGSPANRWASIAREVHAMSFELILPFLRPIEPLLLDESISEIMGNPDASWWYERDGIIHREETISFDAGKLRTGLEVIANQLGKRSTKTTLYSMRNSRMGAVLRPSFRRLSGSLRHSLFESSPAATTRSMTSSLAAR
jgi:Flp pilus assembly CpaF family ATPase